MINIKTYFIEFFLSPESDVLISISLGATIGFLGGLKVIETNRKTVLIAIGVGLLGMLIGNIVKTRAEGKKWYEIPRRRFE
jgi:hypothetical protein